MPLTIGRWRIDRYERAIYLQRQPNPKCLDCKGSGSHYANHAACPGAEEPVIEPCACWDPYRNIRIPLGRTVITERYPF